MGRAIRDQEGYQIEIFDPDEKAKDSIETDKSQQHLNISNNNPNIFYISNLVYQSKVDLTRCRTRPARRPIVELLLMLRRNIMSSKSSLISNSLI